MIPEELQKEAMGKSFYSGGGKTGFFRRLAWDKPSPTLVTHPAMPATDLAHPQLDRPLSIQEYKRIQEFPDNWKLAGSLIQQYKQVGNAVPVSLGFAVGKLIMNLINNVEIVEYDNFQFSRYQNTNHINWEKQFAKQLEQTNIYNQLVTSGLFLALQDSLSGLSCKNLQISINATSNPRSSSLLVTNSATTSWASSSSNNYTSSIFS